MNMPSAHHLTVASLLDAAVPWGGGGGDDAGEPSPLLPVAAVAVWLGHLLGPEAEASDGFKLKGDVAEALNAQCLN